MKKVTTALMALLGLVAFDLQGQTVGNFNDIQFWTGSGTNRAAVVLQWNDGGTPTSLAWGYRWNGAATGFDMLAAIAGTSTITDTEGTVVGTLSGADPRIALGITRYGFGDAVQSIVFNASGGTRTQEDWFSGYWEYFVFGGTFEYYDWLAGENMTYSEPGSSSYAAVSWLSSPVGLVDRPLVDGAWDALSFAPGFDSRAVQVPQAASLPMPAIALRFDGALPAVSFPSVNGLSYQLQFTDELTAGWTSIGPKVPGTGHVMEFHDMTHPLPARRFYRVAVSP